MAAKAVRHMDLDSLLLVNRSVVQLSGEAHEFTKADGEKLKELLAEAEARAANEQFEAAVIDKASLLVFRLASGQHFKAGNKRTALVAGAVFLRKIGYAVDLSDSSLVSAVDRAGMAAASLDDVFESLESCTKKGKAERRSWEKVVEDTVDANRAFLKALAS